MDEDAPMSPVAGSIIHTLSSTAEMDRDDIEPANVVDGLFAIARAIKGLADAIKETHSENQKFSVASGAFLDAINKAYWEILTRED